MKDLYRLGKQDIDKSVESMAMAFRDYPLFQHILADKLNHENIKIFLKFLITYSVLYAEAYAYSREKEGIILFSDFKNYKFNLIRSIRSGILPLIEIGAEEGKRFNEFDRFTMDIHKRLMKENHQYIILIGVDPDKQGQGYGRKLMLPVLELAEEKGQSCYLETHGEKNVTFYKNLGFEVMSEDVLPGTDIIQYAMVKEI
ncbi:MAG: family N-acetyltransferase [Herbinix sp.]|jgi:ribosomal protein S18 acetylase RimI-like enzyme|nr:family N-acetyltransferase [Herbinix sp.]